MPTFFRYERGSWPYYQEQEATRGRYQRNKPRRGWMGGPSDQRRLADVVRGSQTNGSLMVLAAGGKGFSVNIVVTIFVHYCICTVIMLLCCYIFVTLQQ